MVKNGTLASPAMARANRVLPVPGDPTINTPFGILPPSFWNLPGSFKKSTISTTSCLASSTPATSAKVMLTWSSPRSRARLLPKDMAPRPPDAPCIWRMKYAQKPIRINIGNAEMSNCRNTDCCFGGSPRNLTPCDCSKPINAPLPVSGL